MPHGMPDWGLTGPKATVYGLDDMGELAARLGSPNVFDRRGDTVIQDDFETGLTRPFLPVSGLGADHRLWTANSYRGAYCVRLIPGSDDERYAALGYSCGLLRTSRLGLEFSFTYDEETQHIEWRYHWYTGTRLRVGSVRYVPATATLEYWSTAPAWVVFATGLSVSQGAWYWNTGKLVVDFGIQEYVRFLFNDVSYPLAGIGIADIGSGVAARVMVEIMHYANTGHNPTGQVDSVIVTQNEPG